MVFTLTEIHFQPIASLLNFFFWFVYHANHVYKLFITFWMCHDTQTLHWKVLSYLTKFFSTVYYFFSYICWSINCITWVSNFNYFHMTCIETQTRFLFQGFNIVLYGKFISNTPISFLLFYLFCKLFKGLFQPLFQSVNSMSWVFQS